MKAILIAAILIPAVASADSAEQPTKFVSRVDGVQYEATMEPKKVQKTGGLIEYRNGNRAYISEPKGISMAQALAKADTEATKILGDAYTGDDAKWILRSAKREELGEDARYGYYYHFSYCTRDGAYSSPDWVGPDGSLQVVVLLDGTVLENKLAEAAPRNR